MEAPGQGYGTNADSPIPQRSVAETDKALEQARSLVTKPLAEVV